MPLQARTEFAAALNQVASEKGVDIEVVIEAIEQAALAAYRKDLSLRGEEIPEDFEDLKAKIDPVSGEVDIIRGEQRITPPGFARIAAQTAKQVILQKLREAEKGAIMEEYDKKVGTVMSGTITRQEGSTYFVDLGRAEGVMPYPEQTRDEYYRLGQRLKVFVKEIREGSRGPEVVVSRADANLVKGLFGMEVPEIQAGTVVIKDIAREAGGRTKIAAISTQEGIDPVGSLVGQKGVRVQAVMNELGEEKIDIISYSEDPLRYIASALSPAKDPEVILQGEGEDKVAKVKLPASQLSLAIGKGGQNVRLAAKLTGWKIDIEGTEEAGTAEAKETPTQSQAQSQPPADTKEEAVVEEVEKNIDQAASQNSLDQAVVEEPSVEEASESVAQAESDMEKADQAGEEINSGGGDLIADKKPTEEEAPTVANISEVEPAVSKNSSNQAEPSDKKTE
ncbi:MAG: transcription termination factor NusA [Patescibacteria group bacterium]|nr:transcription termination factor NusA [Patescibacteria group bacterium]